MAYMYVREMERGSGGQFVFGQNLSSIGRLLPCFFYVVVMNKEMRAKWLARVMRVACDEL